jgi:high-affinity iron transporter
MACSLALASAAGALGVRQAGAQGQRPEQRLASIVGVAVGEYGKGIDADGRLLAADELDEAIGFLREAKEIADRLSGDRAPATQATLDTLLAASVAHRPQPAIVSIYGRFVRAMGSAGALELPAARIDPAAGQAIYSARCASCHGATGEGDGPAVRGLASAARPPVFAGAAGAAAMAEVSPALMYRAISVGVPQTLMPAWATTLSATDRWNVVAYVTTLRATPADVREGEGLYLQRCASCHGATGAGNALYERDLSALPPEIGTLAGQAERSDAQLAAAIAHGVPGTPMPAARDLAPGDVSRLVAFIRALPARQASTPAGAVVSSIPPANSDSAARAAVQIVALLDAALTEARAGHAADAGDRAFDSYIAFEPLETPARAKNAALVATMERHFADFKGAIKANNLAAAAGMRDEIQVGLPAVVELAQPAGNAWSAFLQSFLIILREGFEAILVVGAVVAFLIKTGHREQLRAIWIGSAIGILASLGTAVVLATALSALPASSEIIEGGTLLLAVVVLFSVSYWLISKVEAAHWQRFIREQVTAALEHGGGRALGLVAFLAVYREGAETALFYQALFHQGPHLALPLSLGIAAGAVALAIVFVLFYRFGVRIPLRPFFAVTSAFLYYMAFVFAGEGIRELQEGNVVSVTLIPGGPHVEALGIYPSVETLAAQGVLVALLIFAIARSVWPSSPPPDAPPPPH